MFMLQEPDATAREVEVKIWIRSGNSFLKYEKKYHDNHSHNHDDITTNFEILICIG